MDEFFLTWLAMEQDIQDEQMTALEDYGFDDDDDEYQYDDIDDDDDSDDEFFEFFEGCLDCSGPLWGIDNDTVMDDEDYDDVQL
jgi:hypothetical protein